MSVQSKRIAVVTNASGVFSATVRGEMVLRAIEVTLGSLSTPDIDITSEPTGDVVLSVNGLAADTTYYPTVEGTDAAGAAISGSFMPFPIPSRLEVAISGGGDTKSGEIKLIYER